MVWCGVVWYGMVWYDMVRYGMVWSGVVCYGMVWCGMAWYGMPVLAGSGQGTIPPDEAVAARGHVTEQGPQRAMARGAKQCRTAT